MSSYHFALGSASRANADAPPLITIGINLSHAAETQADRTVNGLIVASVRHGYSGWIMLNRYRERSPKPSHLSVHDARLSALNCAALEQVLLRYGATEVLGTWGNMQHKTLKRAKLDVQARLARIGVKMFTRDPLTKQGNPRHSSPPGRPLPMLGQ